MAQTLGHIWLKIVEEYLRYGEGHSIYWIKHLLSDVCSSRYKNNKTSLIGRGWEVWIQPYEMSPVAYDSDRLCVNAEYR